MSAMRILLLVLALAAVAFTARYALTRAAGEASAGASGAERSAPAQQLDNVRQKARAIEGEMQRRAEDGLKPAEEGAQ